MKTMADASPPASGEAARSPQRACNSGTLAR
jgi:hypothetical protein